MNNYLIFVLLSIIIYILCRSFPTTKEGYSDNYLLTSYPKTFICSKNLDKSPLNIRVTDSNGIMYVSNRQPLSKKGCKVVPCPHHAKIINDMYTVPEISHYKPLPVHDRTVCWNCNI